MTHKNLLISLLAASAFAVGCEQSDKAATENRDATAKQLDQVKTETKAAAQDMKDYTYAQKTEFEQKMQSELTELNRDLDQLTAKIEKSSAPIKAEAQPKLQVLRDQVALLNKQLVEAKNASETTWDSFKDGFNKAYAASKEGLKQARQWVSDKIAP